jgi:hypothetical protein
MRQTAAACGYPLLLPPDDAWKQALAAMKSELECALTMVESWLDYSA